MQKRVHLIFIGAIVITDMFIYFLWGLLLDGNGTYYGQGGTSHPIENSKQTEGFVFAGLYAWHIINIAAAPLIILKVVLTVRKSRIASGNR